MLLFLSHKSTQ